MNIHRLILLILLNSITLVSLAEINSITAIQSPAWLERGDSITALRPATEIKAGDRIRTGKGGRVLLRLGEGSDIKLGAETEWRLDEQIERASTSKLAQNPDEASMESPKDSPKDSQSKAANLERETIFDALMVVAKGAFRFTTTAISKTRKRHIRARLGTATIGIRGTDLWGRVAKDKTFVVLIEGKIDITRNEETVAMTEPLSLYNAPTDAERDPLAKVKAEDLGTFAAETELQANLGVQSQDGEWRSNLASFLNGNTANNLAKRLNNAGYPAKVLEIMIKQQLFNRVYIDGLVSKLDAISLGEQLKSTFGVMPWPELSAEN